MKNLIVNKLYGVIRELQLLPSEQRFFSEKLRYVLIFFYENLRNLNNSKILFSLRMLFIALEDWYHVENVEDDILEKIPIDPFLKMLKIVEFSMYWDLLLENLSHLRKAKWR